MKIHIVKKGDSLHEIAKKYKVELDQLIAFNREIGDPNRIEAGKKVKIPVSPKPVEPHVSDYVHKHIVNQGDSLWKLCKAWEIPLLDMIKANPQLKNPNVLMTGEVVYIPKLHHDVQNVAYPENAAFTPHAAHESMPLPDQISYPPMGSVPSMPSMPPMGSVPSMPSMPPMGSVPSMPSMPPMGSVPSMPSMPPIGSVPSMPSEPQVGSMPSMPSVPPMGSVYSMPSMPFMTSEPQVPNMPNMPYTQGQMGDISSTHAHMSPAYTAPWLQSGYPTTGYDTSGLQAGYSPEGLKPESFPKDSMMPGLHEPYPQAVHPFQQFSISATEAFAYPSQPGYPMPGMHQLPWGGMEASIYPQHDDYSVGSYSAPGYSDGGCGCGSGSSISSVTEGWNPNPAYPSSYTQYPPTHMPVYPQSTMYPNPSYPIGGELNHSYMPHMHMAPTNFPYPAAYEAPKLPQEAHIHQYETTELTESTEDREVKNVSTSKSKSGAKKNKSSASASLSAYLKRQQREARPEPKPNLPWINS